MDREKLSHRANLYQLANIVIALMVNIIWLYKSQSFNTKATTQKRTENRCHFGRVIFLCSLEHFISKSLQDKKKLQINYTHKCSVWVIVRWTGSSSRRNRIRLVVWWCGGIYRNIIFLFLICWGNRPPIYVPFNPFFTQHLFVS